MISKKTTGFLFSALCIFVVCSSCDRNMVFEQHNTIPGETWNYRDSIHYDVTIADTAGIYNIYLNIRNTGEYPYSNIFLFIDVKSPAGASVRDTFEIPLADKRGVWYGKGTGSVFSLQVPYKTTIKFPYPGIYQFDIQHAMWNKNLDGIADVGIRVERVQ